ncbi:hypothetical protein OSTOST_17552 [Ostertagia ostertagi]
MQLIRRMESAASNLYKEKKIGGFCHLYSGQEACAVGIKAAMTDGDAVITSYRCHGWTLLHGASVSQVLSELTGMLFWGPQFSTIILISFEDVTEDQCNGFSSTVAPF